MKKLILVLCLLFITGSASAQIDWQPYSYFSNTGGLNDAFDPTQIEDNEAADLQNVVYTKGGNWKTRSGFTLSSTASLGSTVDCTGGTYYEPISGTKYLVVIFDDDKIYKMDYATGGAPDGVWDDITGSLTFAVDQDDLSSYTIGEDTLIIEDGLNTTAPYKWTASGNADDLGGSPPNAKIVAYHKLHCFAAGNNSNPSTLYFSDLGDIENWTTGLSGNLSIETNDGSEIRAIVPGFDALYIWKDTSIWRLSGDDKDSFVLQRMVSNVGTLSHQNVARIGNDFIFVDGQGDIYIYDGAIKVKLLSAKIQGTIDDANFSRFKYTSGVVYDKDYYLSISEVGSSTHNIVLVFDTFHLAWTKFDGMNANALWVADDGLGKDMLVFGDYTGNVYEYPSGTNDNGTAIDTYYITKQYRYPKLNPIKDWKLLQVFANQEGAYNLTVETREDFGTAGAAHTISLEGESSLYGTAVYGTDMYGGQNLIIGRIEVNSSGTFFQIKFGNENLDQPIEVKGWMNWIEPWDRI